MSDSKIRGAPPVPYGPVVAAWVALQRELGRSAESTVNFKKQTMEGPRRLTVYDYGRICAVVERERGGWPKAFRQWKQSLRKVRAALLKEGWEVANEN